MRREDKIDIVSAIDDELVERAGKKLLEYESTGGAVSKKCLSFRFRALVAACLAVIILCVPIISLSNLEPPPKFYMGQIHSLDELRPIIKHNGYVLINNVSKLPPYPGKENITRTENRDEYTLGNLLSREDWRFYEDSNTYFKNVNVCYKSGEVYCSTAAWQFGKKIVNLAVWHGGDPFTYAYVDIMDENADWNIEMPEWVDEYVRYVGGYKVIFIEMQGSAFLHYPDGTVKKDETLYGYGICLQKGDISIVMSANCEAKNELQNLYSMIIESDISLEAWALK